MNTRFPYLYTAISQGRSLIFDLDDTIYSEVDFLFYQYKRLAKEFCSESEEEALNFLQTYFKEKGRQDIFQSFSKEFALSVKVDDIISEFRTYGHNNRLKPNDWFVEFAEIYRDKVPLIIVTNGYPPQQKEKVRLLDLKSYFKEVHVIYANETSPKPCKNRELMRLKNIHNSIYVGDSNVDKLFSQNSGFEFIHVNDIYL